MRAQGHVIWHKDAGPFRISTAATDQTADHPGTDLPEHGARHHPPKREPALKDTPKDDRLLNVIKRFKP